MHIDHRQLARVFRAAQQGKRSRHAIEDRLTPSRLQYDWLLLSALAADVQTLVRRAAKEDSPQLCPTLLALDVGSFRCPYRALLEPRGYLVRTLDITPEHGADLVGSADATGLADASVDLLLCTQVLEHTSAPWSAMDEFSRVVKPAGHIILSIPHVWFYHPHPGDYWRITQEGMVSLCETHGFDVIELRLQRGSVAALAQITNFLVYGALGRLGVPWYVVSNILGDLFDRLLPNPLFSLNVACLARRRE